MSHSPVGTLEGLGEGGGDRWEGILNSSSNRGLNVHVHTLWNIARCMHGGVYETLEHLSL